MHHRIASASLLAFATLLGALPAAAQDPEEASQPEVTFQSTELAPGLYMIEGVGGFGGGNVAVLTGEDGVVLVDDSFPPLTAKLMAAVAEVAGGPVDFLVNTHWHGDHSGGNAVVAGEGAWIVAQENVRKRLAEKGLEQADGSFQDVAPEALPVITFSESMTFHLDGQEIDVFHLPHAHTDGDAALHFVEADVLHTGDVFFHGVYPYIDIDSGGGIDGFIAAQKSLLELAGEATKVVPGHGPLATRADLAASIAMLEDVRAKVKALADAGKSEDEAVAAEPTAEHDAMSWEFVNAEAMVRQVYRSLGD